MARRPSRLLIVATVGVLVAGLIGAFAAGVFTSGLSPAQQAALARQRLLAAERVQVARAARPLTARLPKVTGAPAPVEPETLYVVPQRPRQVVGFAPYWELNSLSSADYADTTTLAYFSLEFADAGDGSLVESGPGWSKLTGSAFAQFHASARAAGDRVLLTVSTTSLPVIDGLTAHPAATSARLASELARLLTAYDFDGVDLDIEGRGPADRAGYVTFVRDLTSRLRAAVPGSTVLLDAYPQSASNRSDFVDVRRLAPLVDGIFVMAYAMYDDERASANSPAYSPSLGLSDVQSLRDYTRVVPASKIIFGLPFYGLDFTTHSPRIAALSVSSGPEAVTYDAITTVGRTARWDAPSASLFTRFRLEGQWHQTWYDDPVSLALKTSLATDFHVAGVGAWALGQEGGDVSMLEALTGGRPPVKLPARSP